ncbi:uncharacterized protein WM294_008597 isoform 2-T3 [Sarcoramphus papa]
MFLCRAHTRSDTPTEDIVPAQPTLGKWTEKHHYENKNVAAKACEVALSHVDLPRNLMAASGVGHLSDDTTTLISSGCTAGTHTPSSVAQGLPLNCLSTGVLTRKFAFPPEPPIPAVVAKILSESLDKVMTAIPLWLAKPRFSAHW